MRTERDSRLDRGRTNGRETIFRRKEKKYRRKRTTQQTTEHETATLYGEVFSIVANGVNALREDVQQLFVVGVNVLRERYPIILLYTVGAMTGERYLVRPYVLAANLLPI